MMKILGIETSCDETAVCLIEASGNFGPDFTFKVLGNALYSQISTHAVWGGVYPNLAKREHARNLVPLLEEALRDTRELRPLSGATSAVQSRADLQQMLEREPELYEALETFLATHGRPDLDAIAVTYGPGLEPALWVGVNFARALSYAWAVPLVGVNHLEGHIAIAAMDGEELAKIAFPFLALLISGGHTELDLCKAWPLFESVGRTRDDAAGEAFDKTARLLGIPYPGGAELSRLAGVARHRDNTPSIRFSRPMLHQDNFDFSFSGLKTEVRKYIEASGDLSQERREDISRAFEDAVTDVLVGKTVRAAEEFGARCIVVGGGVSANTFIKARLKAALAPQEVAVFVAPPQHATDNALMIALSGYFRALKGEYVDPSVLRADGNLKLGSRP